MNEQARENSDDDSFRGLELAGDRSGSPLHVRRGGRVASSDERLLARDESLSRTPWRAAPALTPPVAKATLLSMFKLDNLPLPVLS